MKKDRVKTGATIGGIVLLTLASCETDGQDNPIPDYFPHINYGIMQDAKGPAQDSTVIRSYWNNGTGDFFSGREDDVLTNETKTYGTDAGYPGSYHAVKPTGPGGTPEGGFDYFVAVDKNGKEHVLNYIQDGDTIHLIEHRQFANDSIGLFTDADLQNPVTSVRETGAGRNKLSVYPNPSDGDMNVDLPDGEAIDYIKIFDSSGRLEEYDMRGVGRNDYNLNVSGLKGGLHFISVVTRGGETYTGKILINQ